MVTTARPPTDARLPTAPPPPHSSPKDYDRPTAAPPPCTYRLKVALSGSDMKQRALIAASGGGGAEEKWAPIQALSAL